VVVAWLLLSTITLAPYLRAWLFPPPGTAFLGFFYYVDDQYNYLSYVEQAERGAFLFENKLVLEPHAPFLINLEWWLLVGPGGATLPRLQVPGSRCGLRPPRRSRPLSA
jgi:hypothetical protein